MINCPDIRKDVIRRHYDVSTLFYRLLWGRHIHHGYWEADEPVAVAQEQLTDRLATAARVGFGSRVLDIGCGMGGSTRRLARNLGCRVTGVTLSPFQCRWSRLAAWREGLGDRVDFVCEDAEQVEFPARSVDFVWSIECTEHLFDKPAFFRRASDWLCDGGAIAVCAWLVGDDLSPEQERQVYDVCEGFFCPSLGAAGDYCEWLQDAGLTVETVADWTERVDRTWEICRDRVNRFAMRRAARWVDPSQRIFLDRFETIFSAYRSGAMRYGCFVARKASGTG